MKVPDGWSGVKIALPPTEESIPSLMDAFKNGQILHYKFAFGILSKASDMFRTTNEMLQYITVPENGQVTIVGDLHSQIFDLLTILEMQGLPNDRHIYIFNGDFVDRGPAGCEVVLLLYALKAVWPKAVFLNRGNHEARKINEKYDFEAETIKKYDAAMFELFQDTFCYLPLAAVVNEAVLVLHGGLFKNEKVGLKDIKEIKYRGQPKSGTKDKDLQILEDILWSDPKPAMMGRKTSSRGAGTWFGEDVTRAFLEKNKLKMLIRSHELVNEGYAFLHSDLALTVFSASNYCGKSMNKAAFVVLKKDLKPVCTSFMVDESKFSNVSALEKDVVARVSTLIFGERYELAKRFTIYDKAETGVLARAKWAKAMTKVLGVDIPWLSLQPLICPANPDGSIAYIPFLERYRVAGVDPVLEDTLLAKIAAKFLAFGPTLDHAFREMDQDGNGKISYKEFVEALNALNVGLSKQTLYDLMRTLDQDADNTVDYTEFKNRFEIHFNKLKKKEHKDEWVWKKLKQIGTKLFELAGSTPNELPLEALFHDLDTNKDGQIDVFEFDSFLKNRLNIALSESKLRRLVKVLDTNGDGDINISEFTSAFVVFDTGNNKWQTEVIQRLYTTLLKNKTQLRKAFKVFDVNGDGKITSDEFRIGIEALNETLSPDDDCITPVQARELFAALRDPVDDCIDYEKFLESFSVEIAPEESRLEAAREVDLLLQEEQPKRKPPQRQLSSLASFAAAVRAEK